MFNKTSEGWSEQEEEDAELDARLADDDDDDTSEGSEDEMSALQAEANMSIEQLMAK